MYVYIYIYICIYSPTPLFDVPHRISCARARIVLFDFFYLGPLPEQLPVPCPQT